MSRFMSLESFAELRADKPVLIVAVSLVVLFSLYASCIPISEGLPNDHVFVTDQVRFIGYRIFVVLLWTFLGLITNRKFTLTTRYGQFLYGTIPSLLYGLLLLCFVYPSYSGNLHQFMTARFDSPYKSLNDLQIPYFRQLFTIAMTGLSYGVVAGLFARRFESPIIATLIGGALCIAQVVVDVFALVFGFYGNWFIGHIT